jgi:hypothetical protein
MGTTKVAQKGSTFRSQRDALDALTTARESAQKTGEILEKHGFVVCWFQGVPLPDLHILADDESFVEWVSTYFIEPQFSEVAELLPKEIAKLEAGLAYDETSLAALGNPNSIRAQELRTRIDGLTGFLCHVDALRDDIAKNASALSTKESLAL